MWPIKIRLPFAKFYSKTRLMVCFSIEGRSWRSFCLFFIMVYDFFCFDLHIFKQSFLNSPKMNCGKNLCILTSAPSQKWFFIAAYSLNKTIVNKYWVNSRLSGTFQEPPQINTTSSLVSAPLRPTVLGDCLNSTLRMLNKRILYSNMMFKGNVFIFYA